MKTITYAAAHGIVKREKGLAREYACRGCGQIAAEWAYNHRDPNEIYDENFRFWSDDSNFYIPMCKKCHAEFDRADRKRRGASRARNCRGRAYASPAGVA